MWLWILIWALLLFFAFSKRTNKPLLWSCTIVLSLLAGLRGLNMGFDTKLYYEIFNYIAGGGWPIYLEPGWILLNKLVSSLGLGYNWFLWLVSILSLVPVTRIALRDSSNPHLSLFVYYSMYAYLNSFNGMRQFLAISIVLWAFSTLNRGKIAKFITIVLLAATIHVSALVAFLAIAIRKIKLNDAVVWLCIVGSWLAGLVIVNDSILAPFVGKYVNYLDQIRDNTATAATLAAFVSGLFIFIYSSSPKEFKNNYWLKLFFAAIILSNITIQLVQGARIIIYFTIAQIILYPLHMAYKKKIGFTTLVIIVYLLAIFMKILVFGNAVDTATMEMRGVYPYRPLWTEH